MDITFEFATHDDCLDKMVPSDLRVLVRERDELRKLLIEAAVKFDEYKEYGFEKIPCTLIRRINEVLAPNRERLN